MIDKKNIIYLGCSGFPYGLAEIQKMTLISRSLVKTGNAVTIICQRGMHQESRHPDLKASGNYEGIDYVYTPGTPFRSDRFFSRNFLKVKGVIKEISLLKKMKKEHKLDFAILSTHSYYAILYYYILSKLLGFKTILNYVEYYSGVKKQWFEIDKWFNDILYDRYAPRLVNAVFPISEFLVNDLKKMAPQKKYLKVPVLTDFERYNDVEDQQGENYFLFCGAANYIEIVKFIIDSYEKLGTSSAFLYLVINGSADNIQKIRDYISNTNQKDRIKLFSRLSDKQLNTYYKNALALLIPLRPTLQDSARFPHKIGEYLASGSPVVSTNYGEVKHYFTDMENMLIADRYDIKMFAAKMQFVLENAIEVKRIGVNGKNMALQNFEYKLYGERIVNFLNELSPNGKYHS
ncbi:hypothetical protein BH11BAC4_BH11BAC4_04430 [soil metagenome]